MLTSIKKRLRLLFAHIIRSREVRDTVDESRIPFKPTAISKISNTAGPYALTTMESSTRLRSDIIFVTGRFRCGSTALWSAFRNLEQVTAFYEPFNERKFFDKQKRGSGVDRSHLGVNDYSAEYDSIHGLENLYSEDWTRRDLYMDENYWNPAMARFIEIMVEGATGRPVLQFNRIDFRLPWIRHTFPNAKIIHLTRDPRDQWCSTLQQPDKYPSHLPAASVPTNFYLLSWANDLKRVMPFLHYTSETHPYQLFYYLWKASCLFGKRYAHTSISYETLAADTDTVLNHIIDSTNLGESSSTRESMKSALSFNKSSKWQDYADAQWFEEHESICEYNLSRYFGSTDF